jgi:hypothetical protein
VLQLKIYVLLRLSVTAGLPIFSKFHASYARFFLTNILIITIVADCTKIIKNKNKYKKSYNQQSGHSMRQSALRVYYYGDYEVYTFSPFDVAGLMFVHFSMF